MFCWLFPFFFRSLSVQQIEFDTNFTWFVSRSLGFLLEAVVMSIICVKIADVSHRMLVKFADTQQTADLVEQCQNASTELSSVVAEEVKVLAENSKEASDSITGIIHNIVALLQEVRESNQENLRNITEGIEKLHAVGAEADNLGKLQTESGEKAQMVAVSSGDAVEHSKQVLQMVDQMQELLKNTLNRANQIVQESATQKTVTGEVEESFHQVNDVSNSLLEISR